MRRAQTPARSIFGTSARSAPAQEPTRARQASAAARRCDPEKNRSRALVQQLATPFRFRNARLKKQLRKKEFRKTSEYSSERPFFPKRKGRLASPLPVSWLRLLRSEFFRLTFVPHEFERALGLFIRGTDLFLHLLRRLFHLGREPHIAVVFHAGAGRNQAADDHIFFQTAQVIDLAVDGRFGEHARGLLERRRRDERVGGE